MNKKTIGKLVILSLIIIICKIIINGENGFYYLAKLKNENNNLIKDITKLENKKIAKLSEINDLETNPFYSEKIAREKMQMGDSNDHIFLIVKKESE